MCIINLDLCSLVGFIFCLLTWFSLPYLLSCLKDPCRPPCWWCPERTGKQLKCVAVCSFRHMMDFWGNCSYIRIISKGDFLNQMSI